MEFDAEIKASGGQPFVLPSLNASSASVDLAQLIFRGRDLDGLSSLGFSLEEVEACFWDPAERRLQVELVSSQAHDICQILLRSLIKAGFKDVEALIYSDECECVVDDDGVVHWLGERMFIDTEGVMRVEDYPEVEYTFI